MKFQWQDLSPTFTNAVMMNVVRHVDETEITNVVTINAVDVGILTWSLGSLDAPLDTMPSYFIRALMLSILRVLPDMRPQELSRVIWGSYFIRSSMR